MTKYRYSGESGKFSKATVKELKQHLRMIGYKGISKLRTRMNMIDALEQFLS